MTEKELWAKLRSAMGSEAHLTRIENAVSFGTPDVNMGWFGRDYWLELKVIRNGYATIKPTQVAWIMRRLSTVKNIYFLTITMDDTEIALYHGSIIYKCVSTHLGKPRLDFNLVKPIHAMTKPYNWQEFKNKLNMTEH